MTKTISVREARANFSEVLGSVHYTNQPVVVERNGKPYAVVVSPRQFEAFQKRLDAAWDAIDRLRETNAHFDADEVYADVTQAVEEVRQELYERERQAQDTAHRR